MNPLPGHTQSFLSSVSDAALVNHVAQDGGRREEAFAELYRRHFHPAVCFVQARRGLPPEDAEDAAAQALCKVFQRAASFDPARAAFRTWFYRLALNAAADIQRLRRRESDVPVEEQDHVLFTKALDDREILVASGIQKLPQRYQDLIILKYFHGFTEQEIARRLHRPVGTVSTGLTEARKLLRQTIGDSRSHAGEQERNDTQRIGSGPHVIRAKATLSRGNQRGTRARPRNQP